MPITPMHKRGSTLTVQKSAGGTAIDSYKVSRTRRQRGYGWEKAITRRLNEASGWSAFRLGSPSIALPDVLAVSTVRSVLLAIEAKSGTGMALQVPADQIERCLRWTEAFGAYRTRSVILAFKFLAKKRTGRSMYESRRLKEYFKIWGTDEAAVDCTCTYDGLTYVSGSEGRRQIDLADYTMPPKKCPKRR